ncbi:glycoside-pentoside-hexuronide (GPH):cation symporter [Faecalibaculum rodentium]|uniref:glycoside-pentoside-hexuronide (GPH):cation symporter n=1 Tax=Faecalibaculum rodentium TaxID=1702221 RepID=UPI002570E6EF|nr:glycoside-pentoside-hexuronide (GPH):cation symporter [Faecalibaculum rodentium]
MKTNNVPGKVSRREYLGYFSYGFGQCFSYGLLGSFILFFYTDILGISALAASTIFLIARVWDAVNDPMVAGFMDTRRTKSGKFKGYLKFAPLFVVISTILCFFSPDLAIQWKVLYAAITYILWGTVYTVSDIPFWSVSAVITNDPQTRTSLVTAANLGVFAGIGMVGSLVPLLVGLFGQESLADGYFMAVILIMVAGYAFMMFGATTIRERVEPSAGEKVTMKDVFRNLLVNRHLFKMLAIFFLNLFMNIVNGIILYFFIYNMGNEGLMSIYGLMGTFAALGFFLIPNLTKKFRKKDLLAGIIVLDIVVRIVFFMTGYENVPMLLVMLMLTQLFHASLGPVMSSMIAETIEYSEVKTGRRCEAITFSGQTFMGKLSAAIAGSDPDRHRLCAGSRSAVSRDIERPVHGRISAAGCRRTDPSGDPAVLHIHRRGLQEGPGCAGAAPQ